jgi:threonine/homoserine/homoserine lactone efflux protein
MTTAAQLMAFCGVVGLGAMSPGPDFAVVVRRAALRGRAEGMAAATGVATGGAFRDGLLCNALNPKAAVFFLALLPQFLPAHPGTLDTLTLSLLAVAVTLLWFCTVANLVAVFRRVFDRSGVRRALDGLSGAALLGLGARLAFVRS